MKTIQFNQSKWGSHLIQIDEQTITKKDRAYNGYNA
jgi:hypothetical protein